MENENITTVIEEDLKYYEALGCSGTKGKYGLGEVDLGEPIDNASSEAEQIAYFLCIYNMEFTITYLQKFIKRLYLAVHDYESFVIPVTEFLPYASDFDWDRFVKACVICPEGMTGEELSKAYYEMICKALNNLVQSMHCLPDDFHFFANQGYACLVHDVKEER